ncbi:MAG: transcription factor E [Candidatus Jordarchaeum sp.]|uniref:transcription factor E n=1 Tax=Candidatus Jordarchaeum sp. TaxID=2823881 RepID=UPI00404B4100
MTSSATEHPVSVPYQTIIGDEFENDVLKVIGQLSLDCESTDQELAEKTNLTVNSVRKALYKLYDSRIATYRRCRDTRTGHFIHYWKLLPIRSNILAFRKKALLTIEKIKQRLEYERNNAFYHCGKKECPILTFEEAIDYRFKCPVCSQSLQAVDNEKTIKFLRKKILELEAEVEDLSQKI